MKKTALVYLPVLLAAPRIEARRKKVREALKVVLRATWQYVCYDVIDASPRKQCSAQVVREAAADYFDPNMPGAAAELKRKELPADAEELRATWGALSFEEHDVILRETFPHGACL